MISLAMRTKNQIAEAVRLAIIGNGPAQSVMLFDGERPGADDPAGSEPIAILQIPRDSLTAASGGEWSSGTLPLGMATRGGAPTWGRVVDGGGNPILDFDVGAGKDLDIGERPLEPGDPVVVDDFRIGAC